MPSVALNCIASNGENDEFEGIRKEAGIAKFEVLCGYLPEGTEENHETMYPDCTRSVTASGTLLGFIITVSYDWNKR
jgi:hypothetical protein